jgi:cytochrome P450
MATAALIMFAFAVGSVTTSSLTSFAIDLLVAHPELYEAARADRSLAAAVVAEAGRFQSPVQRSLRVATEDRILGGKSIKRGQKLILLIGAANRDPDAFPEPECPHAPRDGGRDVTFGSGRHICVGINLARVESRIALEHFLSLPPLERDGPPVFRPATSIRQLASLPVKFRAS